ncbi:PREDICTED: uncharacterized protein LOC108769357 [Trachymyrmex cornetzi]|uniref:Carboxypeptidase inhibitor n=1 Tax=Trachymyrmex cornetzi TaxID=471704 RepID=A0A195DAM0_9HYME|nr:PREDICTED: uncharacterized protein LOC108769357 [Trachymyrmex cornetzi]KYN09933.1 hypothetical protein ALC57_17930 [Trachymyrmex cornetzi]
MVAPGSVRPLNRRLSESYATPTSLLAERMKSYMLVFVVLTTILLNTEYANTKEICPQENCVVPDHCEMIAGGENSCYQQDTSCCSVVKSKFRTYCRHHGGICTDKCNPTLQRDTIDCTGNQVCCVLV